MSPVSTQKLLNTAVKDLLIVGMLREDSFSDFLSCIVLGVIV